MYGEQVTGFQAAIVTVFSMLLVFLTLILISYFIDVLAKVVNKKKVAKESITEIAAEEPEIENEDVEDDIIPVVICAAAAYMTISKKNFVLKKIRRVDSNESAWSKFGRYNAMR